METSKGITVTQEEVDSFFSDIRTGNPIYGELNDFQKAVIIQAYEKGYNKESTARKLGINPKRMKSYYDEYARGVK